MDIQVGAIGAYMTEEDVDEWIGRLGLGELGLDEDQRRRLRQRLHEHLRAVEDWASENAFFGVLASNDLAEAFHVSMRRAQYIMHARDGEFTRQVGTTWIARGDRLEGFRPRAYVRR